MLSKISMHEGKTLKESMIMDDSINSIDMSKSNSSIISQEEIQNESHLPN